MSSVSSAASAVSSILLSWTRCSVAISLTSLAIFGPQCGARMRPATEGSIRDIRAVRIRSFSSLTRPDRRPARNSAAPSGTRTSSGAAARRRGGRSRPSSFREPPPPLALGYCAARNFARKRRDRIGQSAVRRQPRRWSPCEQFRLERDHALRTAAQTLAISSKVTARRPPSPLAVDDENIAVLGIALHRAPRAAAPCRAPSAVSGRPR